MRTSEARQTSVSRKAQERTHPVRSSSSKRRPVSLGRDEGTPQYGATLGIVQHRREGSGKGMGGCVGVAEVGGHSRSSSARDRRRTGYKHSLFAARIGRLVLLHTGHFNVRSDAATVVILVGQLGYRLEAVKIIIDRGPSEPRERALYL